LRRTQLAQGRAPSWRGATVRPATAHRGNSSACAGSATWYLLAQWRFLEGKFWFPIRARRRPSFLDSNPIRLTALASLFTLSLAGAARRFSFSTAPRSRTSCGGKLPLLWPSASQLSPRICVDMDHPQSRLEGQIIRPIRSVRWPRIRSSSCASSGSMSSVWQDTIAGRESHAGLPRTIPKKSSSWRSWTSRPQRTSIQT